MSGTLALYFQQIHLSPTNIINLQLLRFSLWHVLSWFLLQQQAVYSAGTLFLFYFILALYYYSTTIIKDGFPSANANLVILLVHC